MATKSLAAAYAKNHFGELLDMAQSEPVEIEKKGRKVAVLISMEEYKHLTQLEDEMWAKKAKAARKKGYLSVEETQKLLDSLGKKKKRSAK